MVSFPGLIVVSVQIIDCFFKKLHDSCHGLSSIQFFSDIYRVLSSLHEGIVISDVKGIVRFFNETQAKIDDIDPKSAIGKKIIDIYRLTNETSPTMRCLKSGDPILNETLLYRTRLGKVANIINNVYPLYKSGELIGAINFSKDYQILEKIIVRDQGTSQKKKKAVNCNKRSVSSSFKSG